MKILNHKRAEGLTLILIVIIIVVFLGWLVNFSSKECKSNAECGNGFYCGSDFACHQIPVIEKTVTQNNLIVPSIIMGIAIVVAAIILKSGRSFFSRRPRIQARRERTPEEDFSTQRLKTP